MTMKQPACINMQAVKYLGFISAVCPGPAFRSALVDLMRMCNVLETALVYVTEDVLGLGAG